MAGRKQKQPSDHHFVPQFLLRNFADDDGMLHAFDKRSPDREVFTAPPLKVFFKKNLYTAVHEDGTRDASLEIAFRSLEHPASILINLILKTTRKGQLPVLSADDRNLLDAFVYYQWKRVPDSIDKVVTRADLATIADESVADFEKTYRALTIYERAKLADPATMERIIKNARRDVIAKGSSKVMEAFGMMTFNVVHIQNSKKAFIIASHPVAKLHPRNQPNLSGPATQIWLPLSSDVAVVYTGRKPSRYVALNDGEQVRHVNLASAWGEQLDSFKVARTHSVAVGQRRCKDQFNRTLKPSGACQSSNGKRFQRSAAYDT